MHGVCTPKGDPLRVRAGAEAPTCEGQDDMPMRPEAIRRLLERALLVAEGSTDADIERATSSHPVAFAAGSAVVDPQDSECDGNGFPVYRLSGPGRQSHTRR